ncbi:hydroxymethylglutaryl-CoA lyase [Labrys miyagiensis]|uniref:Hydroxymethylglutaryl-CoA lyase n=1 Tax=Labrys miyagiensis TaxID=346912 RepID=A0ABQ6CGR7_9HYPH|nr:hydroxymethylglutaryl-CoA lyase [Labrys miyagiensis]GLS18964.1 hydroxymethylglutaryl-CoA lyase [Labrys miyagiensis]
MSRARSIHVVEVGPRDGLQNEARVLPVAARIGLIKALAGAGLRTIEAGSFVSPRHVPQMADTAGVLAGLSLPPKIRLPVLVPNGRGFGDALTAGARSIAVFAAASESFSRHNIGRGIDQSLADYRPIVAEARAKGLRVRGYVSCVLGCPYEGKVPLTRVVDVATRLADMGCEEVSLGDTIGVGTPDDARAMVSAVAGEIGIASVALHFHDTYGQALANVLACLDLGVTTVDSAVAGLGGCPYAPGASGNLATEDLVYMLAGLGVETGVDLRRLTAAGTAVCAVLGTKPRSRAAQALAAQMTVENTHV